MARWLSLALLLVGQCSVLSRKRRGAQVKGRVTDETGGALPGVTVELLGGSDTAVEGVTDGDRRLLIRRTSPRGRTSCRFG